MPIFHQYKLVFIHIPKNAGTSMCSWLGLTNLDNGSADTEVLFGQHRGVQLQHLKYDEIPVHLDRPLPDDYRYLAIVRSPRDRLLSEYRWLKSHPFWSRRLERHLGTLTDFLSHLEDLHDQGKLNESFVHFHTQSSFLPPPSLHPKVTVRLMAFENLHSELPTLAKMFQLPLDPEHFPHINKSPPYEACESEMRHLDRTVAKVYDRDLTLHSMLSGPQEFAKSDV